jgi:hypothetical protein
MAGGIFDVTPSEKAFGTLETLIGEELSGSGFNCGWDGDMNKKETGGTLRSYFQAMNENGYYVGYTPIRFTVKFEPNTFLIKDYTVRCRFKFKGLIIGDYIHDCIYDLVQKYNTIISHKVPHSDWSLV